MNELTNAVVMSCGLQCAAEEVCLKGEVGVLFIGGEHGNGRVRVCVPEIEDR